ncbi:MAG: exo-rhamnogalacturonan lyase family protein [Planctomycetota bacterium]|jgi:hypothetical protein
MPAIFSKTAALLSAALLLASGAASAGQFQTELELTEPSGAARQAEPVCGGVPLPREMGFKEGQAFTLSRKGGGQIPCQVLPLVKRADGTLRWVLVDFQDNLAAGKTQKYVFRSAAAPGAKPQTVLKTTETAGGVIVDTGKIKFTISKSAPFGLFSSVEAGGKQVVSGGKITCREHFTGADYVAGKPGSVVLEHAGPLRATVAVKGPFTGDERGKLTYAARITAWAGKSTVHVKYSLCNSVEAHYCFRSVQSSAIALKLAAAPSGTILGAKTPTDAGAEAWLQQGYLSRAAGAATTSTGWKSAGGEAPGGWIAARTGAGNVFAADLYFAADPARRLEVKGGELILSGVIERPECPDKKGLPYLDKYRVLYDCSHLSSQYVIDFAAPAAGAQLGAAALGPGPSGGLPARGRHLLREVRHPGRRDGLLRQVEVEVRGGPDPPHAAPPLPAVLPGHRQPLRARGGLRQPPGAHVDAHRVARLLGAAPLLGQLLGRPLRLAHRRLALEGRRRLEAHRPQGQPPAAPARPRHRHPQHHAHRRRRGGRPDLQHEAQRQEEAAHQAQPGVCPGQLHAGHLHRVLLPQLVDGHDPPLLHDRRPRLPGGGPGPR